MGSLVFSEASHGRYDGTSPFIKDLYNYVFNNVPGNIKDKGNLRGDRTRVSRDVTNNSLNTKRR